MADDGKKKRGRRPLSPEQWTEIRQAHAKGESDVSIAKRLGIERRTIINRRKADGKRGDPWTIDPNTQPDTQVCNPEAVQRQAQAKVIDMATRRALESPEVQKAAEDAADHIATELVDTFQIAKSASTALKDLFQGIVEGRYKPADGPGVQNQAQLIDGALNAFAKFNNTIRLAHGITPGTASIPKTEESDKPDKVIAEVDWGPAGRPTGTDGGDPYGPEPT